MLNTSTLKKVNCSIFTRMNLFKFLVLGVVLAGIVSCQEATDIYLGVPLQPTLEDNNYVPGLNIIGILRPDYTDTISNSFVHVQEVAPAINNYPEFTIDSLIVKRAEVIVSDEDGNDFLFAYTKYDSLFSVVQYRPQSNFSVRAGRTYTITCNYNEFPELNAETIIPNPPNIITESIVLEMNKLSFEIIPDSSSFMYEIYVFSSEESIGYHRLIPDNTQNNFVEVELTGSGVAAIVVYGYDYNLSTYYATSNTSFNFNKYRKPFGDIEGGYGVFGSLNFSLFMLD